MNAEGVGAGEATADHTATDKPSKGDRSRNRLLDAAEERFAEFGIEASSVRSITSAAGMGPAAVSYHFGSKGKLLEAVVDRRGTPAHADVLANIEALEASTEPPETRELVEALGLPLMQLVEDDPIGGRSWLRLVSELARGRGVDATYTSALHSIDLRMVHQLMRRFGHLDERQVRARWRLVLVAVLAMIAEPSTDIDREMILQFVCDGLDGTA